MIYNHELYVKKHWNSHEKKINNQPHDHNLSLALLANCGVLKLEAH